MTRFARCFLGSLGTIVGAALPTTGLGADIVYIPGYSPVVAAPAYAVAAPAYVAAPVATTVMLPAAVPTAIPGLVTYQNVAVVPAVGVPVKSFKSEYTWKNGMWTLKYKWR